MLIVLTFSAKGKLVSFIQCFDNYHDHEENHNNISQTGNNKLRFYYQDYTPNVELPMANSANVIM